MTGRLRTTPIAALAAALLVGCTGQEAAEVPADQTAPSGTQEPTPDRSPAETGEDTADETDPPGPDDAEADREWGAQIMSPGLEGYVSQNVGEWTGIYLDSQLVAAFVIEEMELLGDCPNDRAEPENGYFLALQIAAETGADMEEQGLAQFPLTAQDFQVRLRDGGLVEGLLGNAADCLPEDERLPEALGPGEEASGVVVLDVPLDFEAVVLEGRRYALSGAWEWPRSQTSTQ
ncbi:hypothetical protein [Ornithinimicrobium pratense]|uniref:DUF4352 domain-containing protein n=1 Tax=Ornithinimicrobium pratense TaxID=2593973 RepID=A0A5J6V6Y1_9MICO|nr:hypothetical protein [Ornithinimicrobium pratense]QFG69558.1 hypothetical protein FY030_13355 [Ornithinimicrobium pratense]